MHPTHQIGNQNFVQEPIQAGPNSGFSLLGVDRERVVHVLLTLSDSDKRLLRFEIIDAVARAALGGEGWNSPKLTELVRNIAESQSNARLMECAVCVLKDSEREKAVQVLENVRSIVTDSYKLLENACQSEEFVNKYVIEGLGGSLPIGRTSALLYARKSGEMNLHLYEKDGQGSIVRVPEDFEIPSQHASREIHGLCTDEHFDRLISPTLPETPPAEVKGKEPVQYVKLTDGSPLLIQRLCYVLLFDPDEKKRIEVASYFSSVTSPTDLMINSLFAALNDSNEVVFALAAGALENFRYDRKLISGTRSFTFQTVKNSSDFSFVPFKVTEETFKKEPTISPLKQSSPSRPSFTLRWQPDEKIAHITISQVNEHSGVTLSNIRIDSSSPHVQVDRLHLEQYDSNVSSLPRLAPPAEKTEPKPAVTTEPKPSVKTESEKKGQLFIRTLSNLLKARSALTLLTRTWSGIQNDTEALNAAKDAFKNLSPEQKTTLKSKDPSMFETLSA